MKFFLNTIIQNKTIFSTVKGTISTENNQSTIN